MSRRGKISELYDLAAIESQQATVLQLLNDVVKAINDVKPVAFDLKGAEKTKEIVTGIKEITSGTNELIKITGLAVDEVGQLTKMTKSYSGSLADQKVILDKYQGSLQQNAKLHTEYKIQLDELKKKQKELNDQQKVGGISLDSYKEKTAELALQQQELKLASSELVQTMKAQIKENQAAEGSYDQLHARLGQLRDLNRQLSDDEKNSTFGKQLAADIEVLDAHMKGLDANMGNYQRNVGNYAGAFKGAFSVLQSELAKVKADIGSGAFSGDALASLQKQEALLSEITEGLGKSFNTSREEMRAFQEAAAKIGITLGQQSEAFQGFKDEVGQGVDALQDIRDSVKLAASDTGQLDNMIKAAQGLAGAYAVGAGAAELFGANSEEAQEATRKLAAIMTILQGLQGIQNELTRKDSILRKAANFLIGKQTQMVNAQTAAMQAQSTATNLTTKATKGLGIALKAIGIGILLALIPIIAKAADLFDGISSAQEKNLENSEKAVAAEEEKLELLNDSDNILKSQGKSENEILRLKIKQTDELIKTREQQLELQKETLKGQVEAATRNKRILKGILEFMTAPLQLLINTVTGIANFFGADWEFNLAESVSDLIFDPEEVKKEGEESIKETEKALNSLKNQRAGYELAIASNNKQAAEKRRAELEKALADEFNRLKYHKEKEIEFLKSSSEENAFPFAQRLKSLEDLLKEEESLILAQRDQDLKMGLIYDEEKRLGRKLSEAEITAITKQSIAERTLIEEKAADAIVKKQWESAANIIKIRQATTQQELDEMKAHSDIIQGELDRDRDNQIKSAENIHKDRIGLLEASANRELDIEYKKYAAGKISKEEYESARLAIENKARRAALEADIQHYEKLLEIVDLPEEKRAEALEKLRGIRKQMQAEEVADEKAVTEKKLELQKQYNDSVKQLVSQAYTAFTEAIGFRYDDEKNKIQGSIDALEEKKGKEIEAINATAATAEEKAAQIKLVEARTAAEREKLERRQKQIDIERAKFEKLAAIFNIGVQTIQDVAKIKGQAAVLAANPATLPLVPQALMQIPIVLASGALSAGLLAARPIPKYAEGIYGDESHPGGWAMLGDGGKREYVVTPSGSFVTSDSPHYMNLPKGTQVFPDADQILRQMTIDQHNRTLSMTAKPGDPDHYQFQNMTSTISGKLDDLRRTIKDKRENHFHVESPLRRWSKSGDSYQHFLNNY